MKTYPWLLLHPNIPKPLHGLAPRTILGDNWWNQTKIKAKQTLNQHCWACGVHKSKAKYHQWLEAHECYSINFIIGCVEYVGTCALCHSCHNFIHDGRMQMLVKENKISWEKYRDILNHGNQILKQWLIDYSPIKTEFINSQNYLTNPEIMNKLRKCTNKIDWIDTNNNLGIAPDWEDYYLILFGQKYEANFKSYTEWFNYYN